jgi:hypothetical protein
MIVLQIMLTRKSTHLWLLKPKTQNSEAMTTLRFNLRTSVFGLPTRMRALRPHERSDLLARYHPAEIAFFIHIEYDNRQVIFHT